MTDRRGENDSRGAVLVRCDVGPRTGVGHVMRSLALAEELLARGHPVTFCGDVDDVPLAVASLRSRGIPWLPAVEGARAHAELARSLDPRLVVVDSYLLQPEEYDALRVAPLLAFVDGPREGRPADFYLDQNVGSEADDFDLPHGSVRLAGLTYALMRDEILAGRPAAPRTEHADVPRVFAFLGGTDPTGAAPRVAQALVASGAAFNAVVVAAREEVATAIAAVEPAAGQSVRVIPPTSELVRHVNAADLVVSAAGGSTWELCCLGAASALVSAAGNQLQGYRRIVDLGAAAGLGTLDDLGDASDLLRLLLTVPERRNRLRAEAWRLVDGRGRERVVDALLPER